jgi:hypothetical protein
MRAKLKDKFVFSKLNAEYLLIVFVIVNYVEQILRLCDLVLEKVKQMKNTR